MTRKSGLQPGWHLFKLKADAVSRRAQLADAAEQLGQSVAVPLGLEEFEVAPCRRDLDHRRSLGQLRATAATIPPALEFRCSLPFLDRLPAYMAASERSGNGARRVSQTIDEAWAFDREEARRVGAEVTAIVERAIRPTTDLADPVRVAGRGGSPFPSGGLYLTIDLTTVGHDLQLGIDRISAYDLEYLEAELEECVTAHSMREAIRRKAIAAGAVGYIDGTAVRILASSGLGLPRLLDLLERSARVELSGAVGGRPRCRVKLEWRDGVVTGTLGGRQDSLRYSRGILRLPDPNIPETLLAALPGRRLDALLTHPLVPPEPIITEVKKEGIRLRVTVTEDVSPIPATTSQPPPR